MTTNTIEEIDRQISKTEQELNRLKNEKRKLLDLPLDKRVAIILHDNLCRHNHTDQCDWYYYTQHDIPMFPGSGQQEEYLHKARKLLEVLKPHIRYLETEKDQIQNLIISIAKAIK